MTGVLLVEDDAAIGRLVIRGLVAEGFTVDWRRSVAAASAALAERQDYDVAVLDLGLPDGDGLDICRLLHASTPDLPVLMLTARGALEDRLDGLRAGADDYLAKPFAFEELVLRLGILARRGAASRRRGLICGALRLDLVTGAAMIAGVPLALSPREFGLLAAFAARAGRVVSRDTLQDETWGPDHGVSSNALDVYVGYVRRALGEHATAPRIETVRGVGFRLMPCPK